MNKLKNVIHKEFRTLSILFAALIFSIFLLAIRIKLNGSFRFLFLVWNLFLALIPFTITIYLKTKPELKKLTFTIGFMSWLLFLPNAPYIVTDLIHLKWSDTPFMWLDILLVTSFALNGLVLFYLSLVDMKELLLMFLSKRKASMVLLSVFILTGFGVYLGRFLRFNSWDILQRPNKLIEDIFLIIIQPKQHFEAWLFTFTFSVFLIITYQFFKTKREKLSS